MRPRLLPLLFLVLPATLPARADDRPADIDAGKKLLAEGDSKADAGETTEAVIRYKQGFEQLLPGLRGLPFRREVRRDVTERDDLRKVIVKELDEDQPPEEFRGDELGMKALGLIPRELDLKKTLVELYTEQIAAFYDPKTGTMHLIKEPAAAKPSKPSLLERLLGKTGGFDKDENKVTIAHELTHALADQHFGLDALQANARGDDDRQLALSALVEGEATLAMLGAQLEDWKGKAITALPAADLDRTFRILQPFMLMSGGPRLHEAPPILAESLVFPYLRGLTFCAHLTNDGGWEAVNAAYRNPPLSTEQILHPEKYLSKTDHDAPTTIDLPRPLDAGPGWKELARNVVGELQLSVLLRRHDGRAAAAGWDGDTFASFEGPEGRLGLVWATTWDTEADACEFARSYARFQTTKLGPDIPEPDAFPDAIRRPHHGALFAVERRGLDVVVVEGFPGEATGSLIDAAFGARKSEKTHAPAPRARKPKDAQQIKAFRFMLGQADDDHPGQSREYRTIYRAPRPKDHPVTDRRTQAILAKLERPIAIPFEAGMRLEDVVKHIKEATAEGTMPGGIPIYVDPVGLRGVGVTPHSPIHAGPNAVPLKVALATMLKPLRLGYQVQDGLLVITAEEPPKDR